MTFAELTNEVYAITNRADLVVETASAIKAATLKAHQLDFYAKDLVEFGVNAAPPAYTLSWDYRGDIPRFRALKYIRKYDSTALASGDFFSILTPEQLFDSTGAELTDVAYIAGNVVQIKSSTEISDLLVGVYVHPDVTSQNYTSWIAIEHPYAIVFEAARVIFKTINDDAKSSAYEGLVAEQFRAITISQLTTVGY